MTIISERSATREIALQTRLLAVLLALVDAARCQSFKTITTNDRGGFDVHTVGVGSDEQLSDAQRAEIESDAAIVTALRTALDKLDTLTRQLLVDARNLDQIGRCLPTALDNAVLAMLSAEADFEHTSRVYVDALTQWAAIDSMTGRIRARCARQLVEQGMSPTAADKAASDHADYTAHKDRCVELAAIKDEAEVERDVARTRAINAKTLVDAMVAAPMLFMRTSEQRDAITRAAAPIALAEHAAPPAETYGGKYEARAPGSAYGIICREHGAVPLTDAEYDAQMNRPDRLWVCPLCGDAAQWDDDRYEAATGNVSGDDDESLEAGEPQELIDAARAASRAQSR